MLKQLIKPGRVILLELAKENPNTEDIEIYQATCIDKYGASIVAFNPNTERGEKTLLIICTKKDCVQLVIITPGSVTGRQMKLKDLALFLKK